MWSKTLKLFGRSNMKISLKTKKELFNALKNEEHFFGVLDVEGNMITFLNEIWDLKNMPSEDDRFQDAYRDTIQHTVNNEDWDIDYIFHERFKLFESNKTYIRFLEKIVSPKFRSDEDKILRYVLLINSFLEADKLALYVSEYNDDELPIYTIKNIDKKNHYIDLPDNDIQFYVNAKTTGRSDKIGNHETPPNFPSFVLAFNDGWNDYSNWTTFTLFYYQTENEVRCIGDVKITDGSSENTTNAIPNNFVSLEDSFCSLGQKKEYYSKLKELLGRKYESVLFALKDAAFYPDVHDKFEKNWIFRDSLLRTDTAERLLREAKHFAYGYDLRNLYSFKYSFKPKYSKSTINIDFSFNKAKEIPDRIFAIIGKNGTGKTQLITSLPLDISNKNLDVFVPRPPMFSKVIAVSYSIFDDFEIPKKTSQFNYVYCGLHQIKDGKREILSPKGQSLRFHRAWKKLRSQERMDFWHKSLSSFIDKEIIDSFVIEDKKNGLTVSVSEFSKVKKKLSSGQSIMLYIITEIISNIRYDSLILFDEPETHLHPNAISQLMNQIFRLVKKFDSYCLITTHSPIIIQELLSRNVYVLEKHVTEPSIRKIGFESFGENLSVLTEEVFSNKEIGKQYKKIIDRLIDNGYNYDDIIKMIKSDDVPVSLNTRLYIKSRVEE